MEKSKNIYKEDIAYMAITSGFSIITYDFSEAVPDGSEYVKGTCRRAYPEYSWKVIAMWAWLMSRCIDWLEDKDFVDITKVVAAGHSRYGKAALCCGIYDDRVAVCAPVGSYWFLDGLKAYGSTEVCGFNRESDLPFDSHFMGAALAPRALLVLEGLDDSWSNPYGTQISWMATSEVYQFLERTDSCALHFREGGHEFNLEDWSILLDFAKVVLNGDMKQTNYKTRQDVEPKIGYAWSNPKTKGEPEKTLMDHWQNVMKNYKEADKWLFEKENMV